jgi:hypothetical protein
VRKLSLAFIIFVITISIFGCNRFEADKYVATIDKVPITEQDFVNEYLHHIKVTDIQHRAKMETEEDAKAFLNNLISARVIAMEAEADGYMNRPDIIESLNSYLEEKLVDLLDDYYTKDLKVTEEQLKQAYDNMKVDVKVRLIALDDENTAKKVAEEVKQPGADFASLAKKYSTDILSKDKGGELPILRYYPAEPWISIFAAKVGDIVGPITIPSETDKWGVFKVEDRIVIQATDRPPFWAYLFQRDAWHKLGGEISSREPLAPFENIKGNLEKQILAVEKAELFEKQKRQLMSKYPLERKQDVLDIVYKGDPSEWRKPENRNKIIATVAGHPILYKSWFEGALLSGDLPKMRKENPKQFMALMEGRLRVFWKKEAAVAEALALGLDKRDDVVADLAHQKMRILGETYITEKLATLLKHPSPEQITDYFNKNREKDPDLKTPEQISGYIIRSSDRSALEQLQAQAQKGIKLEEIARQIPGSGQAITIAANDDAVRELYAAMKNAGIGNLTDIVQIEKNYFIARTDKIIPPQPMPLQGEAYGYLFELNNSSSAAVVRDKLAGGVKPEAVLTGEKSQGITINMIKDKFIEGDPKYGDVYSKLAAATVGKPTEKWEKEQKYYVAITMQPVTNGVWNIIDQKLFSQYCATDDADKIIRDEIDRLKAKHDIETKEYEGNLRQAFKHLSSPEVLEATTSGQTIK